jgi:spore coat polysaccharide biosynthesis protein SpsF (cytidylyltransferase family)
LDENDVLGRYAQIMAKLDDYDTVCRITGDCPMLSPRVAEQVIALYRADPHVEYASNIAPGYVDGEDVEVFSAEALAWAHRCATKPYDREHVTSWIRRNVKTATLPPRDVRYGVKTSVDTIDDLERVRQLMAVPA